MKATWVSKRGCLGKIASKKQANIRDVKSKKVKTKEPPKKDKSKEKMKF